jgi:uncharacterized protein
MRRTVDGPWGAHVRRGTRLIRVADGESANMRVQLRHDQFQSMLLDPAYPCVMGSSVIRAQSYGFGAYPELGAIATAKWLLADLEWFIQAFRAPQTQGEPFTSFICIFDGPLGLTEHEFETLLWRQLGLLHEADHRPWDPTVSSDPADPHFSFSLAGESFFVIGLHGESSRTARHTSVPALVFNRHEQFEILRRRGQMDRISGIVHARDMRLQGSTNSMLAQYGMVSEARQYAGRVVEQDWVCPFTPRDLSHVANDLDDERPPA